jgi:hypothetical protein
MRKYNNFKKFLEINNFILNSSFDEFNNNNSFTYSCKYKHKTTISKNSFINKKIICKNNLSFLCTECKNNYDYEIKFENQHNLIFENTGHILLTMDNNSKYCSYQCGNCYAICNSIIQNLTKKDRTIFCSKCIQENNKLSINQINEKLQHLNYLCIKYINNKNLTVICDKKHKITTLSLHDYIRGRKCPECAPFNREQTNIEKYGCSNVMHNPEIYKKSKNKSFSVKEYITPSGKKYKIQGYENYCLDNLYKKYKEKDIVLNENDMPKFYYKLQNIKHRYYPDIMIQNTNENYFIEVKSSWTYKLDFTKNIAKWRCVLQSGFDIYINIYNENGTLHSSKNAENILQNLEFFEMNKNDINHGFP